MSRLLGSTSMYVLDMNPLLCGCFKYTDTLIFYLALLGADRRQTHYTDLRLVTGSTQCRLPALYRGSIRYGIEIYKKYVAFEYYGNEILLSYFSFPRLVRADC
jgi:hypothetical protein